MSASPLLAAPPAALTAALDGLSDALLVFDAHYVCAFANARAGACLHRTTASLVGESLEAIVGAESAAALRRVAARSEESGGRESYVVELPEREHSGTRQRAYTVLAASDGVAMRFVDGEVEAAHPAEATERSWLDAVFDAMPFSMAVMDPQTRRFVRFNNAAHELLGYTRAEFAQLRVDDVNAEQGDLSAVIRHVEESPGRVQFQRMHRSKDGTLLQALATATPFSDGSRRLLCGIWTYHGDQEQLLRTAKAQSLLLDSVLANVPLIVGITDARGRLLWANQETERLLGWNLAELVGTRAIEALVPDAGDRARAVAEVEAASGLWHDGVVVARDGTPITCSWCHVRLADGRTVSIGQDRHEVMAAEATRRVAEERLRLAMDSANQGLWDIDIVRGRCFVSSRLAGMMGRSPTEQWLSLEEWTTHVYPEDRERRELAARAVLDGKARSFDAEYRMRVADGHYRWVHSRGMGLEHDAEGRPTRVVGTLVDITEQHELQLQLSQARKMEAIGQLAGGVAHDFNNLLTVASANLERLDRMLPPELPDGSGAREAVSELFGVVDRSVQLVRQLLLFSRQHPLNRQRLRLGEVVRGTASLLRRLIGEEIALELKVADEAYVLADRHQLEQVLLNLAVNARDAMLMPRHGRTARGGVLGISLTTRTITEAEAQGWGGLSPGEWVELAVRDTGHGMDEETRARIFDPFFTTKEVGKGTGLGLPTVYGIVRASGGVIRVLSAPGEGSTFLVLLPSVRELGGPDGGASGEPRESVEPTREGPSRSEPVAMPSSVSTILLAEDEAQVREVVCGMLERGGHRVLVAADGREALERWRVARASGTAIDAIVTDVRMPDMGGIEFVRAVRREAPEAAVVFMTGYDDSTEPLEPWGRMVQLAKPFRSGVLLEAVREAMHGRGHAPVAEPAPEDH